MNDKGYIRWFDDLGAGDVAPGRRQDRLAGRAVLRRLSGHGVKVPNGFAITAQAYRDALTEAGAWTTLHRLLDGLDKSDVDQLAERAAAAREIVYAATGGAALRRQIVAAYRTLKAQCGGGARRRGAQFGDGGGSAQRQLRRPARQLSSTCAARRRCSKPAGVASPRSSPIGRSSIASTTASTISRSPCRSAVMKMVRSDIGASGVIFTLDTETGFRDVVFVTGGYGLGENIVQGAIDPDEFYVHKPTFRQGLSRGAAPHGWAPSSCSMTYGAGSERQGEDPQQADLEGRAGAVLPLRRRGPDPGRLRDRRSRTTIRPRPASPTPMDIEWAKDGEDGKLYIVQARPETVASRRVGRDSRDLRAQGIGPVARHRPRGRREDRHRRRPRRRLAPTIWTAFRPGEILVAETTTPDWQPVMKTAAAIVTNRGGRTCHAAIVARELGVPAVVGHGRCDRQASDRRRRSPSPAPEAMSAGSTRAPFPSRPSAIDLSDLPEPKTEIMVNLGDPDLAFRTAMLPSAGVGLARMEFIISEHIGIHPMALAAARQGHLGRRPGRRSRG